MRNTLAALVTAVALVLGYAALAMRAQPAPPKAPLPGVAADGSVLLPNGWRIAPAGRHVTVGDLPLAIALSADGRYAIVTNDGYAKPSLAVVDLQSLEVKGRLPLDQAWLGLAWHPDGSRLYSAGGNGVDEMTWADGVLTRARSVELPPSPTTYTFAGGLAIAPDGKRLFVTRVLAMSVSAIDVESGKVEKTVTLPAEPYTCLMGPGGKRLYVSIWGAGRVLVFDPATLEPAGEIAVGDHPNAMVVSPDGRLFVACANTNAVWAVDLATGTAEEQISIALFPKAPAGSTPNALALASDGRMLLVANADNNSVAVVDVSRPGRSRVAGFIPVGWYPTSVAFSRDGTQILVLSGKGLTSVPNPQGPSPYRDHQGQYVAGLLLGSLSVVPVPDAGTLAEMTKKVYRLTPYSEATRLRPARAPAVSPIPGRVGAASPIKYVFYVIRENRTYDQVLGDLKEGNGDPSLCLFGDEATPNAHALAREFVLFDNFYADAEVSYDGHAFSTGAYATDIVEKMWPTNYAGRGGAYLSEGGGLMRGPYGNIAAPSDGYIWDACTRAGTSVRSYGEFVMRGADNRDPNAPMHASVPGLEGRVSLEYPPFDMTISDNHRVDVWLKEFREFERNGNLPRLSILRLPDDHTAATRAGSLTPRSMVADNDLALGRIVEAISKSRYWKESAIFVLEDDAQNGADHVDAHRSVLLAISPFSRRHAVDSTLYSTSGVLRTIELVLGLPPMSQYDAAATPLYNAFQTSPDPRPFAALGNRVPLDERNPSSAYGAAISATMDLSLPDRVPDLLMNEIIWRSIRGADSPMPPPRRSAFVRPIEQDDRD
jgi:YVTN family beta-propeller protein